MTRSWIELSNQILFFSGIFALLFVAMSSSSEEIHSFVMKPVLEEVQQMPSLNLP